MAPCQIWDVAPHLCGLPSDIARRRLILVLKAFIDESGKGDPPIFVMAGFIARAEQWASFNDAWREALSEPPHLEFFHLTEAVRTGDFARIRKLVQIIKQHVLTGLAVTVFHDDYSAIYRRRVSRRIDRPYFHMYHSIMALAFQWEINNGINEQIDFIFDEQNEESDFLQSIFTNIVAMAPPEMKEWFGNRPIHADDKKVLPLQAADLLAGSLRRISFLAEKGETPEHFIDDLLKSVPLLRLHWTREMMSQNLTLSREENFKRDVIFEHEFDRLSQHRDVLVSELNQHLLSHATTGSTIPLFSIPAKGMKRFLLVHKCPRSDSPHLHRRSGDVCLADVG
jgi:hypothetical protein